jgi:hypothetical protein
MHSEVSALDDAETDVVALCFERRCTGYDQRLRAWQDFDMGNIAE